jgi:triacylglycerol lipase
MSEPWPDSAITMTLAAIAYEPDIPGQLRRPGYATAGDWPLVWGPVTDDYGNLAYVAQSGSNGRYALVIRGTETTFSLATLQNWFYDLDVLTQVVWPYFAGNQSCRISNGAFLQASNLTSASWSGQTLASFLTQEVPADAALILTGHSLGGNLASVLASWISSLRGPPARQPDPNTVVYTFAAPSAGDMAFASAFNARFPRSWRYWNSLDVAPRAWDHLPDFDDIYDGIGIPTPGDVQVVVDAMEVSLLASEVWYDSVYEQPNSAGSVLSGHAVTPAIGWVFEAAAQHASNMYLSLLEAPIIKGDLFSGPGARERGPVLKRPRLKKGDVIPRGVTQLRRPER